MTVKKKSNTSGGIKGFFTRASKSFLTCGLYAKDSSYWVAEKLCRVGFMVATVSIVVLMPLVFEIAREGQMIESERLQVKELRAEGFSDRQLQEMGYLSASIDRAPAVATMQK
mmetsp:Transcript_7707/g.14530  ORF Transcript_7707/g.14530 Transcript_7707/m.14530 type:complete len:113 (-) Transcript_7707:120-458(-)